MTLLATRDVLQLPPARCSLGEQAEQVPLALHVGFLPTFGVRPLADGEEAFCGAPQLMDNAGAQ